MDKKKLIIMFSVLILFTFGIFSFTYTRPIFSVRTHYKISKDNKTKNTIEEKTFIYLSLKKLALLGQYNQKVEMDSLGNTRKITHTKKSPSQLLDNYVRYYTMEKYYDKDGNLMKVNKRIYQTKGLYGETIVDKTILYFNGKKIVINNKDRNLSFNSKAKTKLLI